MDKTKQQKHVCVTGLGHIGLPTACILATSGYTVFGVDIDETVVNQVHSTTLKNPEPYLQDLLIRAIQGNTLKVSTITSPADIHLITVPTLLAPNNRPDISYVNAAIDAVIPHLRPYNLVLVESTCPIGTTEKIAQKIWRIHPDVHVAYCPERVLPGNILHELIHNDRIVGGADETSTLQAAAFYRSFIRGDVVSTDVRMAEAVKLAENTYRDVNIAYANELSMIADRIGLNINTLIQLANRHPRVQILNPGAGVGGHCIAVDPWYLVASAPELTGLTTKSREINIKKTEWVIQKIRTTIKEKKANVVVCLGLTYKADASDTRNSPALAIVQALEEKVEILRVDPYVPNTVTLHDALTRADIVVGLVAHSAFCNIPANCLAGKTVLDFAGIFK